MPFASLKLKPGVNLEMTPSLNDGGISFSNLIRFREGMVEKLGGWAKYFPSALNSTIRALTAWEDLNVNLYLGVGAENILAYIKSGNPAVGGSFVGTGSIGDATDSVVFDATFDGTTTINVTSIAAGPLTTLSVGMTISGPGVTGNPYISAFGTGSGGLGTYIVNVPQPTATATCNAQFLRVLTITNVTSGVLQVGSILSGTNVQQNSFVTFFVSGTGGIGTYLVNAAQTVPSTTITAVAPQSSANITPQFDATNSTVDVSTTAGSTTVQIKESGRFVGTGTLSRGDFTGTGDISGTTLTITSAPNTFIGTGSISGYTLSVATAPTGALVVGSVISGTGITQNTFITAFGTGTGGVGDYTVNTSQTASVTTITSNALTVGSIIDGTNVLPNTRITALGSGAGATGTYTVNTTQTVASTTIKSFPTLDVSAVTSGALTLGMAITGTDIGYGTYIASFGTGTGGTGTYILNNSFTLGPETITGQVPISIYDAVYIQTQISVGGIILFGIYQVTGGGQGLYTIEAATPATSTVTDGGAVPVFDAIAGQSTITVTLNDHGYYVGQDFVILLTTTVGGLTLYGNYPIQSTPTVNTFTIQADKQAVSSGTASLNGGLASYYYYVGIGPASAGGGYGTGPYGAGGYGVGATVGTHQGTPITTSDWFLDNFGQTLIANPFNGPLYLWNPGSGVQNATVITQAPAVNAGFFIAMPERQIVTWGSTVTGIQDPLLVRWCDVQDYTIWSPSSTNQAGSYRIPTGNRIVGCIQASQQGLIFTDIDLYAMQYVQPPLVYGFNKIASGCGLIAPKAVAQQGPDVFWMSQRQFFTATGQGVQVIDCPVWDYVYQNLDLANVNKIRAASNSQFHEITWYFPGLTAGTGDVSNYVKYNTLEKVWDFGELARTAWIDQSVLGPPIGSGTDNYIYQHEISQSADGNAMPSYFQTGYFSLNNAEDFVFVDYLIPDMKWGDYGSSNSAQIDIYANVTNYPNDTPTTYGPYLTNSSTEVANGVRFRGRLAQFQVGDNAPGNPGTVFWRMGNIRYRANPDGRR
jgi:hypothetical protein